MVEALELGHQSMQPIIDLQIQDASRNRQAQTRSRIPPPDEALDKKVFDFVSGPMNELLDKPLTKDEFYGGMDDLQDKDSGTNSAAVPKVQTLRITPNLLPLKKPLPAANRPSSANASWSRANVPMAATRKICARSGLRLTLVPTRAWLRPVHPRRDPGDDPGHTWHLGEAQEIDCSPRRTTKRYMHHYNFPPYSVGETRPLRGTEHGARSGMVHWQNAPSNRSSRRKKPSLTPSGWSPNVCHPMARPRWHLSAALRWH